MEAVSRLLAAREHLRRTRPMLLLNPTKSKGQVSFLSSRHIVRGLHPGNGWGKTTILALDIALLMERNDPFKPDIIPDHPPIACWFTMKYNQFDIIRKKLEQKVFGPGVEWNETKHRYTWPATGGQLYVFSAESDWETLQGIEPNLVVFDEHPDKDQWNEAMARRRGEIKCRFAVAATMTQGLTWYVREVIQPWEAHCRKLGMTGEEARDRQPHPEVWIWDRGGVADNPAMSEKDAEWYAKQATFGEKEKRVRLQGGYADFTGTSVFEPDVLDEMGTHIAAGEIGELRYQDSENLEILPTDVAHRLASIGNPIAYAERAAFGAGQTMPQNARWVRFRPVGAVDGGTIRVFERPNPTLGYVIGCDAALGLEGRDYDTAVVLSRDRNGMLTQVAEARGYWGDVFFAWVVFLLGTWYFNAFIVGERQGQGLSMLRRLHDEFGYTHLYRGRNEAAKNRRRSDMLGHHRNRWDTIVPNLRLALRERRVVVRSELLLEELRAYQWRPRASTIDAEDAHSSDLVSGAPPGMHDDLVMALAYAIHAAQEVVHFDPPRRAPAPGTFGALFGTPEQEAEEEELARAEGRR